MKKLLMLFSLLLILAVLVSAPKPALADGSCPLPGSSAYSHCLDQCTGIYGSNCSGSMACNECVSACVGALESQAAQYCNNQHVCCNY